MDKVVGGEKVVKVESKTVYLRNEIIVEGSRNGEVRSRKEIYQNAFFSDKDRSLLVDKRVPQSIKIELLHECILPAFTYGMEVYFFVCNDHQ